jgi:hypothetical protein
MASQFINPALIANSVPTPDPNQNNPLSLAEGVAKVQQLQRQQQLAPVQAAQAGANLQSTQLANQKSRQDLSDQQAFGAAIRDSGGDPDKLVELSNQTISDPWTLSRVQNMASEMKQRNAKTTADQDLHTAQVHGQYAGKLQSVIDAINSGDTAGALKLWTPTATQALAEKDPGGQSMVPGTIDPNVLPDVATLQNYQTWLSGSKNFKMDQAKQKQEDAQAAVNTAKALVSKRQTQREDIADMYSGVGNEAQHEQFKADVQKKYPDLGGEYANLPFDPENTPAMVERMAMDPKTRVLSDYNQARAASGQTRADAYARAYGGYNGMVARAHDPGLSAADRAEAEAAAQEYVAGRAAYGAPTAQIRQQQQQVKDIENDQKQHGVLDKQKNQNQALDQSYQSALNKAKIDQNTTNSDALATDVDDPLHDGKTITAGQAIAQMRAARAVAADQATQQQEIEKRRGWGQFAPKQASPAPGATPGTTAPPAAPAGTPPVTLLKEGAVTNFKNGQSWMLRNGKPVRVQRAPAPGTQPPQVAPQGPQSTQ